MFAGFERRVTHGGKVQVPEHLVGRTVLLVFNMDGPICGVNESHVRSLDGSFCHICETPLPEEEVES